MIPLATGIAVLWSYTGGRVRKLLAKSRILCFTLSFRNHSNRSRQSFSPLIVGKGNSYTRSETEQRFSSRAGGPSYETTTETLFQYWKPTTTSRSAGERKLLCGRARSNGKQSSRTTRPCTSWSTRTGSRFL